MPRVTPILRKGRKALEDLGLVKILQSEIKHELSTTPFQDNQSGSLGDFKVDWDSMESQDVVLRRKCESGEEVAVSALLGQEMFAERGIFPREVLMKVCVKKTGLNSVLQFDCGDLDSNLQDALKGYLIAKGIGEDLTNFLLLHLHKKELGQYVKWLQKLESLLLGKFDELQPNAKYAASRSLFSLSPSPSLF
ncbi:mitochondrial acidic protein [Salix suchowensis]|nr:mitochondrial acidic protein [Salix suchowensis]